MAIEVADYGKAVHEAEKILEEHNLSEPPIVPQNLVKKLGLQIKFVKFINGLKEIAGYLDIGDSAIYVNSKDCPNKQAFTIAHELGHWIMHKEMLVENPDKHVALLRDPSKKLEYNTIEQEANCFAANLLVPKKMLDRYKRFVGVKQLADLFVVSKDVVENRLKP